MALVGCPSNNSNSPSAPVTVIVVETPTYPPCVMNGFTCTPSLTPTFTPTLTLTPTATLSPTLTLTPADWAITSPVTLTSGQYSYVSVHVETGGVLNVQGAVTVSVSGFFAQDASTTITGDGTGYPIGQGPTTSGGYSGGGGHGGAGGADATGFGGAAAYDSSTAPATMGDGGGSAIGNNPCAGGSAGGGLFVLISPTGPVTLNGLVSEEGAAACNIATSGNGGGAGGAIYVKAVSITGTGTLRADGGAGTGDTEYLDGGGGGGGIIVLSTHSGNSFSGAISVAGGAGGTAGLAGSAFNGSAGITNTTTY